MPFSRELPEVIAAAADGTLEGLKKIAIGYVTAVNGGFVDVQLMTQSPLFDEFGNVTFEPAPAIGGVPLCVMRGGGFSVSLPVSVGDSVLVVFTDLSADTWRASQGTQPVAPGWVGRHTWDSAFALPCVAPDASAIAPTAGKVVIGKGSNTIAVSASDIELAGTGDFVALASKVLTELTKIQETLATGSNSGGPVVFGTPYSPSAVASATVKIGS
jgi:Phage protein Gp138 N-terminal domain